MLRTLGSAISQAADWWSYPNSQRDPAIVSSLSATLVWDYFRFARDPPTVSEHDAKIF
jgi:hypothetical protein